MPWNEYKKDSPCGDGVEYTLIRDGNIHKIWFSGMA